MFQKLTARYSRMSMMLKIIHLEMHPFQAHIYTTRGRILETILSLRFFIFQFGVVYHMNASDSDTSLLVC
jgi:hypothetical protein